MAEKMGKSEFPSGHGPNDFECFGPPATRDGEFGGINIADMGCFTQDGKDSNKYYHAAVVKSRKDGSFYTYFEWGRTGATSPQFQFQRCSGQAEAQSEFAKQCAEKNSKRGEWVDIPGIGRTLRAKAGKDCYLVRPLATRVTGLPDAKTIKLNEGAKVAAKAADEPEPEDDGKGGKKKPAKKAKPKIVVDKYTTDLLRDLGQATVAYTKSTMADASLPTQVAIEEARQILQVALTRLIAVGDNVDDQVADRDLINYTNLMYGRIPKRKAIGAAAATWILSANNILGWQNDLDAFESALYVDDGKDVQIADPYNGMNIHMEWVSPDSDTGKFIHGWWPGATRNVHGNVGAMEILNAWKVIQHDQSTPFQRMLATIKADPKKVVDRCLHQPDRTDLDGEAQAYRDANVNLMFHGTRSVNVPGILRERLKLPKQLVGVVINGAMFGPGLYWADDWKKSAQYTSLNSGLYSSGSGQVKGRHAFMFAADVTVGNPHLAKEAHGYTSAPNGYHTVYGKGGTTKSWGGSLLNNEWIVYEGAQHQMRYLIEFREKAKVAGRRW